MSNQSKLSTPNLGGRFSQNHPAQFGKYIVVKILGRGGFGSVYLVKNDMRQNFVLKVSHWTDAQNLKREYNFGRMILHPSIVFPLELFEEGDFTCLLFEYVQGQTLSDFMQKEQSMKNKKNIVQQLALAVAHLHSICKIAHLDLKPENLLIFHTKTGFPVVKIIDFGLASDLQDIKSGPVGTVHYMAPEVAQGFDFSPEKADIWSLGKIIAWILTGENIFFSGEPITQLYFLSNLNQSPIPEKMKSDPKMFWGLSLCQACLEIDQNERASATKLLEICASIKFD
jgi:serine/threonine protein kinase